MAWEKKLKSKLPFVFANAIIAVLIGMAAFPTKAAEVADVPIAEPLSYKKYHVHYEVNADGTYSKLDEIALHVETERGVLFAKQMPIWTPGFGMKKEVQILSAYTLKKNGQRIDAIQIKPEDGKLSGAGLPIPAFTQLQLMEFQDVVVGDTLIFSYKVIQSEALVPNNVVVDHILPIFMVYDGMVSLSFPSSLDLRLETFGIETGSATEIGGVRNWIWKYQNKKAEISQTGKPIPFDSLPRIYISSFKDRAAEIAAFISMMPKIPTKVASAEENFTRFKIDAEAGNANAQFWIGTAYESGAGVTKSEIKSVEWYMKAAAQGHIDAQIKVGNAYIYGMGLSKNVSKALSWFRKAAALGSEHAHLVLGRLYSNRDYGIAKDYMQAVKWYQPIAKRSNVNAQFSLGEIYQLGGFGVNKDVAKAVEWYQKAASQNFVDAQVRLGLMYEKGDDVAKNIAKAAEWYLKASNQGNGFAQFYLSLLYEKGEGIPKDTAKAEAWLQKAAAHGWDGHDGLNTYPHLTPDRIKAVEWFKKGAERGNASAQYRLGDLYRFNMREIYGYSSGVDNDDDEKAFEWYMKAAKQGHGEAQYDLGTMYRYGKGVVVNANKAVYWYKKAAVLVDAERKNRVLKEIRQIYASGELVDRNGAAADIHFISAIGIGPVKLGMTLAEAKKALPAGAKFEQAENAEGADLISVELANQYLMILRPAKENPLDMPIDWSRRISYIQTFNPKCHTIEGIHPGSRVRDVEKILGKTIGVSISEIESREYIDFKKQSKRFLFRSDYVGIYPSDDARQTTKVKPDGEILSITVSSDFMD